jgi:K+-transporting ATPase ATPase B chain
MREREMGSLHATFVPFTAQTRMSGVDIRRQQVRQLRKGAADRCATWKRWASRIPPRCAPWTTSRRGSTPLVVVDDGRVWAWWS